jgi:CBS domain-containing protein
MVLTALELYKTDGVLTAGPESSLAQALAKMHSSHDAVFVTAKNKLLGVISPYHVLYRGHYPQSTKLKNCLFLAPKLKPDAKPEKIAKLMIDAKIYFLPVVTPTGKWLGVISYRRILRRLKDNFASETIKNWLKPKPLVKIKNDATIGQARNLMKQSRVSRLVVVDNHDHLTGIITRYDLGASNDQPPATSIKTYIKRDVATIRPQDDINKAITTMLDKRIGSLVIVNGQYQPIGLLSVRDCLEAIARPKPKANGLEKEDVRVTVNKVRSGWEVFVRAKDIVAHATHKFRGQALRESLKKLKSRLRKS